MPWGVVAGAIVAGVASDRAADKQSDAAKKGIASTEKLATQARNDAINLFNLGKQSRMLGQGAAFNFIRDNATRSAVPLVSGNMMAQRALGQGGIQANNAILGLPVDMSFAQNPQQVQAEYPLGTLPTLGGGFMHGVLSGDLRTEPLPVAEGNYSNTGQPHLVNQDTKPLSSQLGGWENVRF